MNGVVIPATRTVSVLPTIMVQALSKGVIVKSPCMLRMLKAISMAESCSCQLVLLEKKRRR